MTKISDMSAILATAVDRANDLITLVDVSLTGVARNKKMTVAEAGKLFAGWNLIATSTTTGVGSIDFTGLAGYNDILLIGKGVTGSVSSFRGVVCSIDNGSTFLTTSGDYVGVTTAGVESNATQFDGVSASSSAALTFALQIVGINVNGAPKRCISTLGADRFLVGSLSPVTAIRYRHSSGGNITGGTLYLLGR